MKIEDDIMAESPSIISKAGSNVKTPANLDLKTPFTPAEEDEVE